MTSPLEMVELNDAWHAAHGGASAIMPCSGTFGTNPIGQYCMNPQWLAMPLAMVVILIIVVLYVWGDKIWAWSQRQRRKGGIAGFLFWAIGSTLAILGLILGTAIGFIGTVIIIGTVISFIMKVGK